MTLYGGVRFPVDGPDLENIQVLDHGAVKMTGAMMGRGIQVDPTHFEAMAKTLQDDMDALTAEVQGIAGGHVNLDSGDQVSKLLFKTLGLKQARRRFTPKGDRESTDEETLIAIQHDHPVVGKILDYKELSKLRGTYVVPMPKLATRVTRGEWRMFPNLGMSRIPSGRYNAKEPNLLAMPNRTSRGREIRRGFITRPGWKILSVDESQIEVRIAAHSSKDPNLIGIYERGEDIYSDFATSAFSLPDERYEKNGEWKYPAVNKTEHRFPSKTCILSAIYDISAAGLLEKMPVVCANCKKVAASDDPKIPTHDCDDFVPLWTELKCQHILGAFYGTYPGVLADRKVNHTRARRYGYVWDMWGRILHVGAVRSVHTWVVNSALREVGNFPYQAGAGGTLKLTMAQVYDDFEEMGLLGDVVNPLLPIHDELLMEVREDMAAEVAQHICHVFEHCVPLAVPIKAGWAVADTWGDVEK